MIAYYYRYWLLLNQYDYYCITILSAVVQGVLVPWRIEEPYALDDAGGSGHSPSSYLPTAHLTRKYHSGRRATAVSKR